MDVRIPIPGGRHVPVAVHIVDDDIAMKVRMEVIYSQRQVLDFGNNIVSGNDGKWKLPMIRKLGHIFLFCKKGNLLPRSRTAPSAFELYAPGGRQTFLASEEGQGTGNGR